MKAVVAAWALASLVMVTGCGYHQAGAAAHVQPGVTSIAVPIFHSNVQAFRTEVDFTQALVRELNTRTKYRIVTSSGNGTFNGATADNVLRGTIVSETVAPLTYDATSGQTSSYLISITANVELDAADGRVLWHNEAFAWREQYQSTQDLTNSLQEDSAAVRRVAHDWAQAVVSALLEGL